MHFNNRINKISGLYIYAKLGNINTNNIIWKKCQPNCMQSLERSTVLMDYSIEM